MKTTLAKESLQESAAAAPTRDIGLIGHVQVSMTAQVGTVTLSVERLFSLTAGDIVRMNESLEAPLTLMIDGRPVARGELLAVDDHFGIRILEVA
ncbi:MAG: FliM/FliN family flagellar motor switch protein [Lysobacteraceae bacterium]